MSDIPPGQRRWDWYVRDMLAAYSKIATYTAGMDRATFVADDRTYDATLRNSGRVRDRPITTEVHARRRGT